MESPGRTVISLLDTVDKLFVDWFVVFRNLPPEGKQSPLWRLLEDGFEHVELWRCDRGIWLRIEPCIEVVEAEAHEKPPWAMLPTALKPTMVRVRRTMPKGRVRDSFFFGPVTCVELAKAFLGVRSMFVRTPYQLYKFLRKQWARPTSC